jgi:hypothetical protein
MRGNWGRVLVLVGLSGLFWPGSALAADDPTTTFTASTSHHRYDVYLGTIEQVRPGASAPYRSENVFESEIRFDKETVEDVSDALAPDSRFADGIATAAPDGGPWITDAARPGWWEYPGGGKVKDLPLFAAAEIFGTEMAPVLAVGESASCTDTADEILLREVEVGVKSTMAVGPDTIWIGDDLSKEFKVIAGSVNVDTEITYLDLTVHRQGRTCVISPPALPTPPVSDRCKSVPDSDTDGIADACDEDPSIPDSCDLRVARSRVFVYKSKPKARLVVRYKTRSPAKVKTTYTATLANGKKLALGSLRKQFGASGTFKLPISLTDEVANKVRAAKSFTVSFSIPGAPKACARAYTKRLTKKATVGRQSVWFQSDSVRGGLF